MTVASGEVGDAGLPAVVWDLDPLGDSPGTQRPPSLRVLSRPECSQLDDSIGDDPALRRRRPEVVLFPTCALETGECLATI